MQYVLRTRDSGSRPFLVVRDTDGEIMGSYASEDVAQQEITRLGSEPPWESMIRAWNAISRTPLNEDVPYYFSRTAYSRGITAFVEAILNIVEGPALDQPVWMLRLEEIEHEYASPSVVREWLREDRARLAPEITGVKKITEKLGRWATRRMQAEVHPVRRQAYRTVQTLAAVILDSIQDYPYSMGNGFAHQAVRRSLQGLREAVSQAYPTQDTPATSEGSTGLRGMLRGMLPG